MRNWSPEEQFDLFNGFVLWTLCIEFPVLDFLRAYDEIHGTYNVALFETEVFTLWLVMFYALTRGPFDN